MQFFSLLYRLNAEDRYLIWISNDKDAVVVDDNGFVPCFENTARLQEYADFHQYSMQDEEPVLHDLDWVASWVKMPVSPVDCRAALGAWNLFSDVATSIPDRANAFEQLDTQPEIYDKLFWGNNIPCVTPEGEHYIPEWSLEQLALLAEILSAGLDLFQSGIKTTDFEITMALPFGRAIASQPINQ